MLKKLFLFIVFISIISCSTEECYECLEGQTYIRTDDNYNGEYSLTTPNFALEGSEVIRLLNISRFDNISYSILNPRLVLKGENSEVFFEGDPSIFFTTSNNWEVPISLCSSDQKLYEGQVHFELFFRESVANMAFSIDGSFLLISCETFTNSEIKNFEECRDNYVFSSFSSFFSGWGIGC